jgi:organic radical activating enzyme
MNPKEKTLNISEFFVSIQGEGLRAGSWNTFIRTQGCKAKHACYAAGVRCDTEFESGWERSLEDIHLAAKQTTSNNIIWTGGEPLDQVDEEVVAYFRDLGYYQCVETSGLHRPPEGLDYIVLSPKVAEHVVAKNFKDICVDELRYVRHKGQAIPEPAVSAIAYYISPHFDGNQINMDNVQHCLKLVEENPRWRISIQLHKLLKLL